MHKYIQQVIDLHSIARALETDKSMYTFARELRDLADRLHRVNEQRQWTEQEHNVMDYLNIPMEDR